MNQEYVLIYSLLVFVFDESVDCSPVFDFGKLRRFFQGSSRTTTYVDDFPTYTAHYAPPPYHPYNEAALTAPLPHHAGDHSTVSAMASSHPPAVQSSLVPPHSHSFHGTSSSSSFPFHHNNDQASAHLHDSSAALYNYANAGFEASNHFNPLTTFERPSSGVAIGWPVAPFHRLHEAGSHNRHEGPHQAPFERGPSPDPHSHVPTLLSSPASFRGGREYALYGRGGEIASLGTTFGGFGAH